MTVLYETTDESFYEDMEGCEFVLVDFYKQLCPPCSVLYPELIKLQGDKEFTCEVMKMDYEKSESIVMDLRVRAAPTLILFKDGKKYRSRYGKDETAETIKKWIEEVK